MTRLCMCVGLFVSLPFGTPPLCAGRLVFLQDATQLQGGEAFTFRSSDHLRWIPLGITQLQSGGWGSCLAHLYLCDCHLYVAFHVVCSEMFVSEKGGDCFAFCSGG